MNKEQLMQSENFLDDFLKYLVDSYEVCAASVFKVDHERRRILFFKAAGDNTAALEGKELIFGEGIVGHVVKSGSATFSNDVNTDKRFNKSYDRHSGFETLMILAAPVVLGEKTAAVIELLNKKSGEFTENDIQKIEAEIHELGRKIEKSLG